MDKFLDKKYKLTRVENLDEILKEMGKKSYLNKTIAAAKKILGINAMLRKLAPSLTTTVQLVKKDNDQYSLNSTILLLTTSQKFKLGEGKDITTQDGRKVKNTFTVEDNKLIETQVGEKTLTIVREYFDDQLIVTTTMGDIVSMSWCKHVD